MGPTARRGLSDSCEARRGEAGRPAEGATRSAYDHTVAGLIRREDVDAVRERTRIEDVVSEHVTLKPAGAGSLKGLCPFHDERTPSFHVRPQVGRYHCFGCGESGDVYAFLQSIDHLSFTEAVERLAGRMGFELRYEEGGGPDRMQTGRRQRLLDANAAAELFFREQLLTPAAQVGRDFMEERGFDRDAAAMFAVGFAPEGWSALQTHLRSAGFTDTELTTAGLLSTGARGGYDRFRGRLVWPIRDITGATVGFGARRLLEADQGPKYLNTPQTPVYNKSQALYGIDLAKRDIAKARQVVVVEGYTDVMAMHLSGVPTAVATCGTAFGSDHIKVVRRLLVDDDSSAAAVIFTFDGDAAGQKAALRAFEDDQRFVAQTFVAVEPSGMDPCELRVAKGPEAVAALVAARTPLFEFAIRSTIARFDLERAEDRVQALRVAAPVVAGIRDPSLRPEYARRLSGWLGMDVEEVRRAVSGAKPRSGDAVRRPQQPQPPGQTGSAAGRPAEQNGSSPAHAPEPPLPPPDLRDPVVRAERQLLQVVLQQPAAATAAGVDELGKDAFQAISHRVVQDAVRAAGGASGAVGDWLEAVARQAPESVWPLLNELAVVPLPLRAAESVEGLARRLVIDARQRQLLRLEGELRGRAQRMEAAGDVAAAADLYGELFRVTSARQALGQG